MSATPQRRELIFTGRLCVSLPAALPLMCHTLSPFNSHKHAKLCSHFRGRHTRIAIISSRFATISTLILNWGLWFRGLAFCAPNRGRPQQHQCSPPPWRTTVVKGSMQLIHSSLNLQQSGVEKAQQERHELPPATIWHQLEHETTKGEIK